MEADTDDKAKIVVSLNKRLPILYGYIMMCAICHILL